MNTLPKDPVMLLSYINTQLRDNYSTLDLLAEGLDLDNEALQEITDKLSAIGYNYDPSRNQFK
ncbi:DUF4250 domain-containing protein [Butyrivibrio sp. MC2013]|uniref:DUF4250 domain-containing protein n=1 Tax=Butyrivibrio sp. MC2013 TaxID=1280686 RepID=UPI00040811B5|nr:DUF4250 domain-containing protein [Butyrivibrio sp. MC2013]